MAYLSYESGIPPEKRNVIDSLSSNFSGTGKYPAITLQSPFQELANWRISHQGEPCRDGVRTRVKDIFKILMKSAEQAVREVYAGPKACMPPNMSP
jgi:hypothetical protein